MYNDAADMPTHYQNAPLVELIAELRWAFGGVQSAANKPQEINVPISVLAAPDTEEFFMRFGAQAAAEGYMRVERLLPSGIPVLPFRPLYRFRKGGSEAGTTLYQLGGGIFSANITPPYHSWTAFRPVVERGVTLLVAARDDSEKQIPFSQVSLRYINAFRRNLLEERTTWKFIREVLRFDLALPHAVTRFVGEGQEPAGNIQLAVALQSGQRLGLTIGDGKIGNETAAILDTMVSAHGATAPSVASVMRTLDEAHDVIYSMFTDLTKKIRDLMQPEKQ
jgi:uncharacterized protein (TIGR04255 family)